MSKLIFLPPLALSTAAIACPPPPPPTAESKAHAQRRIEEFKRHAIQASGIVYGVVDKQIGYDARNLDSSKVGTLRVIHVYQGQYKRGQRVKMRPGFWPLSTCPMPPMSLPKGSYGVVILDKPSDGKAIPHNGFLPDYFIQSFIADGIIQSAQKRGGAASRSPSL